MQFPINRDNARAAPEGIGWGAKEREIFIVQFRNMTKTEIKFDILASGASCRSTYFEHQINYVITSYE